MKIALIHMRHANSGGTERFLNALSRYLAERGEDVTIICRSHVAPSHPAIGFVRLRPFSVGKAHRIWRFAQAVERHVNAADYDLVYALGKTWTHDMLRIGGGTTHHHLASMPRRRLRFKDKVAMRIEARAMAPGAYYHVVSNSWQSDSEIAEAYRVPAARRSVIHNFVDTRRFDRQRLGNEVAALGQQLGLDGNTPVLLFLGTGYRRKGLEPTLEAFARLDVEATLLVVGRDSQQAEYEAHAQRLGIADKCRFLGEQASPERYFALADCYVLPARYEPFGFTVLEALACGTPVITTQSCGAKEVVTPEVATVIDAADNVAALAQAMAHWVGQKDAAALGMRCRELALTLDVEEIMAQNYRRILAVHQQKQAAR
ncbi:glycosyltransferase family 4 protein [Vreelandella subglaciescola]|uniref:UDP-glucose:(Heptosyl)LPS alpha-1,3-glucosyltransferase n=1 Tax=Vreelandella subglaciescola TaxID=29571 RepID=A0A1M7HD07_9GAMM|nr:glycosyltransferase family 4 protein [Halomonas subglaciescola]SHM26328.1 UDP-glucose:(heptosyl)LPS alpha-1,3-glucosyltransferase [Halomonas subglaciescola]